MVDISGYTDPGVYISEVQVPSSVSVIANRAMCLVGIAPRTRRASEELVTRGKIYDETLASWSGSSPYRHVLTDPSNRDRNNAILYKNGNALGLGEWSFVQAALVGTEWASADVDVSTNKYFSISLDGIEAVRLDLSALLLALSVPGVPAAATGVKLVEAINEGLVAATGYGAAYSAAATSATGVTYPVITITSPLTSSSSDVKVFLSNITDAASTISNTGWAPAADAGVQADSYVEVIDASYAATSTWTVEYVSIESEVDPLDEATSSTPLSAIQRVGSFPGASNYVLDTDYEKSSNTVDWDTTSQLEASVTASIIETYAIIVSTSDILYVGINGGPVLAITLTAGGAVTAAAAAIEINAALVASSNYGPEFGHVASDDGGYLKFDFVKAFVNYPLEDGTSSSIEFYDGTRNAFSLFFGATALPYETLGAGSRPAFGSGYYASYDYTRDSTDYDLPVQVFDPSQLYDFTSPLTVTNYTTNDLAIGGGIAFENGAPSVWLSLVNDSTAVGSPSVTQVRTAIDHCAEKSGITEVLALDTRLDVATYVQEHISNMSSILEKKPRRGWYGMIRGTDVGDPDTPDTLVYWSTRVLQPGNTSSGRGRQILQAPANVSRTLTLEDGAEVDLNLDGSYLASAVCAHFTALINPSSAMVNHTITGFIADEFETFTQGERHTLAGNGVNVVTLDAGNFKMFDPLTTEAGGGRVINYEEPSASAQKDAVTATVDSVLDNNVVGVVPDDIADFLADIKQWIVVGIQANIEAGNIGPYRNSNSVLRDIDPSTDIKVFQAEGDPRTFRFRYWFNLKYPAKRFFGEYSVDNPFFSA